MVIIIMFLSNQFGESVLLKACLQGQQKVVEVLVKSKCDVNTQNMVSFCIAS